MKRCTLMALAALALFCCSANSQQTKIPADGKPRPLEVSDQFWVVNETVIRNQWADVPTLVNAPTPVKRVEPGQCIQFGVIASGDGRDEALRSAHVSIEISYGGKTTSLVPESHGILRRIKPEGGDFVMQALGVAGIKDVPNLSMASMLISGVRWCAPDNPREGALAVRGTTVLPSGKKIVMRPLTVAVMSFEAARKTMPFKDVNSFGKWLQQYHEAPDPALLLPAVRIVSGDERARGAGNMMSFFIGALRENSQAANEMLSRLPAEKAATRTYIAPLLKAAGYSIDPLLQEISEDEKNAILSATFVDPFDLTPNPTLPNRMDMMWSTYFATGEMKPVATIISMLAWRDDFDEFDKMRKSGEKPKEVTDSIMRAVSYMAAGWSLAAISRSDGVVADYIDTIKASPETTELVKKELSTLYDNPAFRRH